MISVAVPLGDPDDLFKPKSLGGSTESAPSSAAEKLIWGGQQPTVEFAHSSHVTSEIAEQVAKRVKNHQVPVLI